MRYRVLHLVTAKLSINPTCFISNSIKKIIEILINLLIAKIVLYLFNKNVSLSRPLTNNVLFLKNEGSQESLVNRLDN